MKCVIRPIQDQQRELDVTHRLVSAIADELWKLYGGNDQLNWIEAELHLQRIVGQARAEARETQVALVAPSGARRGAQSPRPDVEGQGAAASRRTTSRGRRHGRAVAAVVS